MYIYIFYLYGYTIIKYYSVAIILGIVLVFMTIFFKLWKHEFNRNICKFIHKSLMLLMLSPLGSLWG